MLSNLVESLGVGTASIRLSDGRVVAANEAQARMLGRGREELLGRPATEVGLVPDVAAIELLATAAPGRIESSVRTAAGVEAGVELAVERAEVDGEACVSLAVRLLERGGRRIAEHTTGRRRARAERDRFEQHLQQAQRLESVGQLAGGIAHDFNNLLAVILNYAHFVREQLPADSSVRADVEEIRHAAARASELTHQLLVFSRRETVRPAILDLNQVVRDTARLLGRTIGKHVSLVMDLAPGQCLVEADPAQLEQVVLNLVVNARDALPRGGEIRIATRRDGEVTLAVTDEGAGMEPEVAARAFEPFFTTKPKGAGTGLGLATVYGTVAQAGGHAEIHSTPGGGTTVRLHLPAAEPVAAEAATEQPAVVHRVGGHGATVLLVEDEDAVRRLTCRILASSGFDCLEASGAEEALRLYDQHRDRVALVLTDLVMPGMSGHELAERLRTAGSGPPVLFMSGYADAAVDGTLAGGRAPLLRKPFTADSLLRSVHDALGTGAAR